MDGTSDGSDDTLGSNDKLGTLDGAELRTHTQHASHASTPSEFDSPHNRSGSGLFSICVQPIDRASSNSQPLSFSHELGAAVTGTDGDDDNDGAADGCTV